MEVSGQRQASAVLPPEKSPGTHYIIANNDIYNISCLQCDLRERSATSASVTSQDNNALFPFMSGPTYCWNIDTFWVHVSCVTLELFQLFCRYQNEHVLSDVVLLSSS
jgi:hypothetical protein